MASTSGTLRSQPARDRILAAAREVFSAVGYERATVRMIATRASVVPAMLIRYFGSKEGVFASAVQFDLKLPDLSTAPVGARGRKLVAHFLERWEDPAHSGDLVALLRASADHAEARDRMIAIFGMQLSRVVRDLGGDKKVAERAALIATQMLGLAFCRYVVKLPPVVALSVDAIIEQVGPTIERYVAAPSTVPRQQPPASHDLTRVGIWSDTPLQMNVTVSTTRQTVLDCASALFLQRGFDAVSMELVRQKAAVSNGSLYHHFPTKADLGRDVYLSALKDYQAEMMSVIQAGISARDGVRALVTQHIAWVVQAPRQALVLERLRTLAGDRTDWTAVNAEAFSHIKSWIALQVAKGDMQKLPFKVWLALVLGPSMQLTRGWALQERADVQSQVRGSLADAAWSAVRSHSAKE